MSESFGPAHEKPSGLGWISKPSDIGVVVVTFHSAETIRLCLERLLSAASVACVVVVDNASTDSTAALVEAISQREPRLRLVRNDGNRGFGQACNQGASVLNTPWVAFVNPDCYVEDDSLARLVRHGQSRVGAGMLGVQLVDEAGVADPAARRRDLSLRELFGRMGRRDDLYLGRDPELDLQPVAAISGAVMLMPLGLFLKLGGFDEAFTMHVEDLDLCRRVRAAGYEVVVANDITVTHVRGVSSRAKPLWVEWQKHRGLWRYFEKFEASETPVLLRPVLYCGLWAHFAFAALRAVAHRVRS